MPTDFSDQESANFASELQRARGYKPVTPREMKQAYKQYAKVGLKFGAVKKTMTDEQLYAKAQKTVLAWWKLQQKEKVQRKKARQRRLNDPMRGMESAWQGGGGGYGSGGGGTSGGGYGQEMLPDTAMAGPGERDSRSGRELPDIRENLTARDVREHLRSMGVPDQWQPPKYAERNRKTLTQWVQRQAARRDLVLQANGARAYFNNAYVNRVSRELGFPMDGRSIPIRYKHSASAIRRYIIDARLAFQRRQQRLNEQQRRESARRRLADEARQRQFQESF